MLFWEIAFFPLPADKQDADKLRDEVIGITTIELSEKSRHHVGFYRFTFRNLINHLLLHESRIRSLMR